MVNLIGTEDLVYKTDSIEGSFREVFGKTGGENQAPQLWVE